MEYKKYFIHTQSIDNFLIGCIYTDKSKIIKSEVYKLQCVKREWNINKINDDIFNLLDLEKIALYIGCINDKHIEKQFKRIKKLYSKIQIKIKYYRNTNGLLY